MCVPYWLLLPSVETHCQLYLSPIRPLAALYWCSISMLNCGWLCSDVCVNTGLFEVSCKVTDHYMGGMKQQYRVKNCRQRSSANASAPAAHYYISAEELEWDYSPNRSWELEYFNTTEEDRYLQTYIIIFIVVLIKLLMDTLFLSPGSIFVGTGENRLGSKYKKVIYREYTDATFRTKKQRSSSEKHLEILGTKILTNCSLILFAIC